MEEKDIGPFLHDLKPILEPLGFIVTCEDPGYAFLRDVGLAKSAPVEAVYITHPEYPNWKVYSWELKYFKKPFDVIEHLVDYCKEGVNQYYDGDFGR